MSDQQSGFQRILVATDFSPCADAALHRAVWIAQQGHCQVVLAHVVADLRHAVSQTSYKSRIEFLEGHEEHFQRELRRNSDERLKQAIQGLGDTGLDITYETLLGEPYVELIHSVQQENYDLVVVGTRGHSSWQRLFLGSTARRLIRKCPASVWVVKRKPAIPPTTMLAAVDMSVISRRALEQAACLASRAGAQLHVLHVVETHDIPNDLLNQKSAGSPTGSVRERIERQATQSLEEFLSSISTAGVTMHRNLRSGTPAEEIIKVANQLHADLIALGTVGRSGIQGLLLGNTAENVLIHCDCDVLTVKSPGFQSPIPPATWPLHPGPEKQQKQGE